jgi:hypothetical protein
VEKKSSASIAFSSEEVEVVGVDEVEVSEDMGK